MEDYLNSAIKQFKYYKLLGERTFTQLTDEQLFVTLNEVSNSVAVIAKHISGNMLSRWTDIFTSDGEKEWRDREDEFNPTYNTRDEMLTRWNEGWERLLDTLEKLEARDLERVIYIRNMGHSVMEAINRQLCHYAYHVGQIVYIGKLMTNDKWQSLSIPKGGSEQYNAQKFAQEKARRHFTEDL